MYTIFVDDLKFVVFDSTIKNMGNILNNNRTYKINNNDNNTILYIDADPDSFKHIISFCRGYDIKFNKLLPADE